MATLLAGIGLTITGRAVLKAGRWFGRQRHIPLLCGVFVLAVLIPVINAIPDLFLWPIAAWSACFVLLGLALRGQEAQRAEPLAVGPVQ
jgi:hypothetical protein